MTTPPDRPQLYHITHIDNLPSILQDGGLRSDAAMLARGGPAAAIGMTSIKSRRLRLPVKCYPGDRSVCEREALLQRDDEIQSTDEDQETDG